MWLKIFGAVAVLVGVLLTLEGESIITKYFSEAKDNKYAIVGVKAIGVVSCILGGLMMIFSSIGDTQF